MHPPHHRIRGILLVLAGGLCLSSGGVLIRSVENVDPMVILFYRAIGLIALMLVYTVIRYRSRTVAAFRATGWRGLVMAFSLGCGFAAYVFGMLNTSVANVSFIISSGPLFAAFMGWLFLRERVSLSTWVVIIGAALGMGLMFAEGLGTGSMFGNAVAVVMPFTFAIMLVTIRQAGDVDMVPAGCLGGVVAALIGFAFSSSLAVGGEDLLLLLTLGVGQLGAGFLLITIGAKYLAAAETALLALTESIAGPIWAWLFISEVPGQLSLIGGLIVLGCVVVQGVQTLRRPSISDAGSSSANR